MKQFNLEEYLKNPERKIVTRDGRAVKRVLCTDVKCKYPIVVVIENRDGNTERAFSLTKDGKYIDGSSDNKDLFFAPEKYEGWLNIYRSESGFYLRGNPYKSKEEADEVAKANPKTFCTTVKIEWEE